MKSSPGECRCSLIPSHMEVDVSPGLRRRRRKEIVMRRVLHCTAGLWICVNVGCSAETPRQPPARTPRPELIAPGVSQTGDRANEKSKLVQLPDLAEQNLLAWFDTLGFPDLANCKFVCTRA